MEIEIDYSIWSDISDFGLYFSFEAIINGSEAFWETFSLPRIIHSPHRRINAKARKDHPIIKKKPQRHIDIKNIYWFIGKIGGGGGGNEKMRNYTAVFESLSRRVMRKTKSRKSGGKSLERWSFWFLILDVSWFHYQFLWDQI